MLQYASKLEYTCLMAVWNQLSKKPGLQITASRVIFIIFIFFFSGCSNKKPFLVDKGVCIIENQDSIFDCQDNSFEKYLYPFKESEYSTLKMVKYFNQGVKIDSGFTIKIDKDTLFFYKYYDDLSELIFSIEGTRNSKYNYNIAKLNLNSELIQLKNDISYGMKKSDLFHTISYNEVDCDTFEIMDAYYGIYFKFIFQNDKLRHLSKEYIH
jgi:hypothetical protein